MWRSSSRYKQQHHNYIHSNQQFANQQFANQQFANQQFTNQQFGSQQFGSQQFANQQFANQQFANQQFACQQFASQQFASQQFASQQFANQQPTTNQEDYILAEQEQLNHQHEQQQIEQLTTETTTTFHEFLAEQILHRDVANYQQPQETESLQYNPPTHFYSSNLYSVETPYSYQHNLSQLSKTYQQQQQLFQYQLQLMHEDPYQQQQQLFQYQLQLMHEDPYYHITDLTNLQPSSAEQHHQQQEQEQHHQQQEQQHHHQQHHQQQEHQQQHNQQHHQQQEQEKQHHQQQEQEQQHHQQQEQQQQVANVNVNNYSSSSGNVGSPKNEKFTCTDESVTDTDVFYSFHFSFELKFDVVYSAMKDEVRFNLLDLFRMLNMENEYVKFANTHSCKSNKIEISRGGCVEWFCTVEILETVKDLFCKSCGLKMILIHFIKSNILAPRVVFANVDISEISQIPREIKMKMEHEKMLKSVQTAINQFGIVSLYACHEIDLLFFCVTRATRGSNLSSLLKTFPTLKFQPIYKLQSVNDWPNKITSWDNYISNHPAITRLRKRFFILNFYHPSEKFTHNREVITKLINRFSSKSTLIPPSAPRKEAKEILTIYDVSTKFKQIMGC